MLLTRWQNKMAIKRVNKGRRRQRDKCACNSVIRNYCIKFREASSLLQHRVKFYIRKLRSLILKKDTRVFIFETRIYEYCFESTFFEKPELVNVYFVNIWCSRSSVESVVIGSIPEIQKFRSCHTGNTFLDNSMEHNAEVKLRKCWREISKRNVVL